MKWNDLIESIMTNNNGTASLSFLYNQAANYRNLPTGDWRKTLRGVLYREANRGRFKKIGLGVYALSSYQDPANSAYVSALNNRSVHEYLGKVNDYHSTIEGMLIEIGNLMDYTTYTSDLNKSFDSKKLRELCGLTEIPDFTYTELKNVISKSDIIWFNKSKLRFPKMIFEVESTTNFTNSMFKMYQMIDFNARFFLVASESRKSMYSNRLGKEPFVTVRSRFGFRSFEEVTQLYFSSVEHYELKSKFLA